MDRSVSLSVIVPVYNVENYLVRCLDSLVTQDYLDKEVLLIDDGSTDRSGEICDIYAAKYSFVRVIHQSNAGLAAVRNIGVNNAIGKFLSFIDSDDYILPGTYSHMFELINRECAEIACFGHINVYSGKVNDIPANKYIEKVRKFTTGEALDQIFFENNIDVVTWNKIIIKEIYSGIEYPVGKLYEDMYTTYKLIAKAKTIISTNYKFYIYCHRKSSIGGQEYNLKTMDLVEATKETYEYVFKYCSERQNLEVGYLYWLIVVANIMIRSNYKNNKYFKEVKKNSRKNFNKILNNTLLNRTYKAELVLFGLNFSIYKVIYKYYIRKYR